ncbi:hypothetical protein BRC77_00925 [Halobacteriales archaeon QH_8_64_26]|nr:MAG: hypothetical protein BRC77_00925 [Halobacteriales archaeon QH_8_64_26]
MDLPPNRQLTPDLEEPEPRGLEPTPRTLKRPAFGEPDADSGRNRPGENGATAAHTDTPIGSSDTTMAEPRSHPT